MSIGGEGSEQYALCYGIPYLYAGNHEEYRIRL